jgi:choline-glycine betaine transporter
MITIFCDFRQFSAKKLAFFSKTNVMIQFFAYLALFCVKNANFFAEILGENILKIITSVPEVKISCATLHTRRHCLRNWILIFIFQFVVVKMSFPSGRFSKGRSQRLHNCPIVVAK